MTIIEFRAQLQEATGEGSTMTARLVPYGDTVPYGSGTVRFEAGGITVPADGLVPLTVDHGKSVTDRIGVMIEHRETADGMYADFKISDTPRGQEIRTLLLDGAISDVSVGVAVDTSEHGTDQIMSGQLDHVSIVTHGRFATGTKNPSKVLSVHNEGEPAMDTENEAAAPVVAYDDAELRTELVELAKSVDQLSDQVTPPAVAEFTGIEILTALTMQRAGFTIDHALADVIGDLGSADASGVVPDFYWGGGLQHKVDRRRPLFATAGDAPFPSTGNNLVLPRVTQATAVATRAAEKGAANSQALQAVAQTYPIQWFDGAVDVALEIISQSDPSIMAIILSDMLTQYAAAVELDATTRVAAVAIHTGAALDVATYAALVADIITTSDLIEDATGAPGDILGVTPTQWIAILGLMDGGDRRQFSIINPSNADGTGSLVTRGIDVGGVFVYRAPAATTALQYNSESVKAGEKSPVQVAALNVELMGRDFGILGATVVAHWAPGIYSYEIV